MIVAMDPMSTGTVLSGPVLPKSFPAETRNAFAKPICVTEKTIVGTAATKISLNVKQKRPLVLAVSSGAKVVNALHTKGSAINRSIATMAVTNRLIVMWMSAPKLRSISANTNASIL